jgi:hypothetical protein
MLLNMRIINHVLVCSMLAGCQQSRGPAATGDTSVTTVSITKMIAEERDAVNPAPVAKYSVPVPDDMNDWRFTVSLYETKQRFTYRVVAQYQEVSGEDSIVFPNVGMEPKPLLQKGKGQYSCIIGFADKQGQFRPYKEVSVRNEALKITTLKHYAVYSGQ